MYLTSLEIENLKLIRHLRLSFCLPDGSPRKWTVLVGENGLCKTTILQAIAMTACGYVRANQLADVPSLPDRRHGNSLATMEAHFSFSERFHGTRHYPGLSGQDGPPTLESRVSIKPQHNILKGTSCYAGVSVNIDPLEEARARNLPLWFVAGYGTSRILPRPMSSDRAEDPILDRLNPLFDRGRIIGTGFADLLENPQAYARTLKQALIAQHILPRATDIELRGRGGVRSAADLNDRCLPTRQSGPAGHVHPARTAQRTARGPADSPGYAVKKPDSGSYGMEPCDTEAAVLWPGVCGPVP